MKGCWWKTLTRTRIQATSTPEACCRFFETLFCCLLLRIVVFFRPSAALPAVVEGRDWAQTPSLDGIVAALHKSLLNFQTTSETTRMNEATFNSPVVPASSSGSWRS
jgi:hypothetical protein